MCCEVLLQLCENIERKVKILLERVDVRFSSFVRVFLLILAILTARFLALTFFFWDT